MCRVHDTDARQHAHFTIEAYGEVSLMACMRVSYQLTGCYQCSGPYHHSVGAKFYRPT
jgi:hypothetical protein